MTVLFRTGYFLICINDFNCSMGIGVSCLWCGVPVIGMKLKDYWDIQIWWSPDMTELQLEHFTSYGKWIIFYSSSKRKIKNAKAWQLSVGIKYRTRRCLYAAG